MIYIRTGKKQLLFYLSWYLESLCNLTHPFVWLEIKLTGRHCNLSLLSMALDDKYKLDVWTKQNQITK